MGIWTIWLSNGFKIWKQSLKRELFTHVWEPTVSGTAELHYIIVEKEIAGEGWIFAAEMWGVYTASMEKEQFCAFRWRRLKALVSWQNCCRIEMSEKKPFKRKKVCLIKQSDLSRVWLPSQNAGSCSDPDHVFPKGGGTKRYNTTQSNGGLWCRAQLTGRPPECRHNDVDSYKDCSTSALHLHRDSFFRIAT